MSDVNVDFNITGEWLENLKAANAGLKDAVKNVENLSEAEKKNLDVMAKGVNLNKQAGEGYKAREKQVEVANRITASFERMNETITSDSIVSALNKIDKAGTGTLNTFQEIEAEAIKLQQAILDSSGDIEEQARLIQNFASQLSPEDQINFFAGAADGIQEIEEELGQLDGAVKKPRQRLKELKDALSQMDETDPGFRELAIEAANLEDKIGDVRARITNLAADGKNLNGVISAVEGLTGAFAVGQGVIGLFGDESEDLQKSLLKVQSVMAVLNGLQAIQNTVLEESAAKSLVYANAQKVVAFMTGGATAATNAWRAALLATGIGALIVAIGLLAANWDKVKGAISGVTEEQSLALENAQKIVEAEQKKLDILSDQDSKLKLMGKTEEQILQYKHLQALEVIEATRRQITQQQVLLQAQIEAEKRNKSILQGIIEYVSIPISFVLKQIDAISNALGRESNLFEKFTGSVAGIVFDPEETTAEGQETIKSLQNTLDELTNKSYDYELQLKNIRTKGSSERVKEVKKSNDLEVKNIEDFYKKLLDLENTYETERRKLLSPEDQLAEQLALNDELISIQEDELRKSLDLVNLGAEERAAAEEEISRYILELRKLNEQQGTKELAALRAEETRKQREELLSSLSEEEELARASREVQLNNEATTFEDVQEFERYKAQELLKLDLELANQRRDLLINSGVDANDIQVKQLEATIGNLEREVEASAPEDKSFLSKLLGIDEASVADTKQILSGAIKDSIALINQVTQARIEASQAIVDQLNTQISEQEKAVDREKELQKEGLANSVESSQNALEELKKQRRDAIEEQEKLRRRQAAIEGLAQAGALVTSATQMFASQAPKGLVGVALAIGAISTIFAYIQKVKKDASSTAIKARRGLVGDNLKLITGRSHEQGGERLLDHVEVEGDEMVGVLSRGATRKYRNEFTDMVMSMNNGQYKREFNSAGLTLARDPEFKEAVKIEREMRIAANMQAVEIGGLKSEISGLKNELISIKGEIQNWPKTYTDENGNMVTKLGTKKITRKRK